MKTFRSFLTESKNSTPKFEPATPVEDRIDTAYRIHMSNERWREAYASLSNTTVHPLHVNLPDKELPYQELKHGGQTVAKGYVESVPHLKTYESSSKNISPANKKLTILSHHVIYGEGYESSPSVPKVIRATTVMAPSGKQYVHTAESDTPTYGHWHTPTGEKLSSMDVHNHFRVHEPAMFPKKKVNEHFYDIKKDTDSNLHTISIANTTPFRAKRHDTWSHAHSATRDSLDSMMNVINDNAAKYGHSPYKVKAFYEGVGQNNAIHINNGKDDAVILHQKRTGGSTKTMYNKHGRSGITWSDMNNHATVFGAVK